MKGAGGQGYNNIEEGEVGHFFRYRVVSIGVETHVSIPVHPIIRYLRPISFIGLGATTRYQKFSLGNGSWNF